ncbi:MAG: ureidoglycolate lyase [Ahniella sp.]|nr:ureidoglycolate lyase [Ahniella sp.]
MNPRFRLSLEPLTAEAFAPFGEVIGIEASAERFAINAGTTERLHALARVAHDGGQAVISIGIAQSRRLPFALELIERHPLGSQAFVPLDGRPYIVVVASTPADRPRAFLAANAEGVNFRAGTWHHPLIALADHSRFLIIDREGTGDNCEEVRCTEPWWIDAAS